jgi:hypothetical protein
LVYDGPPSVHLPEMARSIVSVRANHLFQERIR